MPGRGESEWLADPNDDVFPTYLTTLIAFIARSGAGKLDWVGTSMGGLLGIVVAAQPKNPIGRLVVTHRARHRAAAIDRIRGYFGLDPTLRVRGIEQYVRSISAPSATSPTPSGNTSRAPTSVSVPRPLGAGLRSGHRRAVPRVGRAPRSWRVWNAIRCPTLVLRGAQSDLLRRPRPRNGQTGSEAAVVEFADVGHAPMLLSPEQIDPVAAFLRAASAGFLSRRPRTIPPPRPGARRKLRYRLQSPSPMALTLTLSPVDLHPVNPPETRPAQVVPWLDATLKRDPVEAARLIGDALAATNAIAVRDARRLELAERYWTAPRFSGPSSSCASCAFPTRLPGKPSTRPRRPSFSRRSSSTAYKRVLEREANRRVLFGRNRSWPRCSIAPSSATGASSSTARCPMRRSWREPGSTHTGYMRSPTSAACTRVTSRATDGDARKRVRAGAAARARQSLRLRARPARYGNPLRAGAFALGEPHRCRARAPDGEGRRNRPGRPRFPPFSASKGGAIEGSKIFLLAFDLAFQIRNRCASSRRAVIPERRRPRLGIAPALSTLLKRPLRQWAIPPARQFNRLPSRARW